MMEIPYHYQFRIIVIGDTMVGKSSLLKSFAEGTFGNVEPTVGVDFFSKIIELRPESINTSTNTSNIRNGINTSQQRNYDRNSIIIKLQIWDTAGQERFKSIVTSYYRNSVGILLVYDVTNRQSYEHLQDWLKEAIKFAEPDWTYNLFSSSQSSIRSYPLTSTPTNLSEKNLVLEQNNESNTSESTTFSSASDMQSNLNTKDTNCFNKNNASKVAYLVIGCKSDLESEREVCYEDGLAFANEHGFKFIETSSKEHLNIEKAFEILALEIYNKICESGNMNRLHRTESGQLVFDDFLSISNEGIRIGPLVEYSSRRYESVLDRTQLLEAQPVSGFLDCC